MSKLFARAAAVAVLAVFAAPAFPCEAMKQTTASVEKKAEKKETKAEAKKAAEKPAPVASAQQAKR
jgi:hypothetical protein